MKEQQKKQKEHYPGELEFGKFLKRWKSPDPEEDDWREDDLYKYKYHIENKN